MSAADDRSLFATQQIRNRIKCHRKVRAGDLVPHELNYRFHPERQRAALDALWKEAQETIDSAFKEDSEKERSPPCELKQQFMVLIPCRDEKHQVELLERFQREGLECKAVLG